MDKDSKSLYLVLYLTNVLRCLYTGLLVHATLVLLICAGTGSINPLYDFPWGYSVLILLLGSACFGLVWLIFYHLGIDLK